MQNQIAVVGGCNIDISATSYTFLIEADSNPGYVKTTLGGVGRNIAENLLLLGYPVSMITPLSRDSFLSQILSHSVEIGLDLSHSVYFDDVPNSVYLCINHPNGDIALAVSCMEICEKLTPDVISTQMDFLNSCPYVVLDANLRADTLAYIAEHCHSALCADAVSVKKAERLRPILHRLTFLKVNRAEAEILVGFPVNDFDSVSKASALLHAQGIPIVAITMGSGGAFLSNGDEVNYSGCGDAFFAGVLHGSINRKSTSATLRCGLAMSALSASSPCAVSPDVSAEALEQILSETKEEK